MSTLSTIAPQEATGRVAEIYDQVQKGFGRVPNALQLFSVSPHQLEMQWQHLGYYSQHPTLGYPLLATMRMLISLDGNCQYCVGANESGLIHRAGFTPEQTAATKKNPADAPLSEKEKAMLLFVLKAMRDSNSIRREDLASLRALGWTDQDLFDGLNHAARHAAVDVLFNAFQVEQDF